MNITFCCRSANFIFIALFCIQWSRIKATSLQQPSSAFHGSNLRVENFFMVKEFFYGIVRYFNKIMYGTSTGISFETVAVFSDCNSVR